MKKKWILSLRQRCDLELLLIQGFFPLKGFLSQEDYVSVLNHSRLQSGDLWPIPINLDVSDSFASSLCPDEEILLCDEDNSLLAKMRVTDKWKPNKALEADAVFGTQDQTHPGVAYLMNQAGDWYLGGEIELISLPKHNDFTELRHTPASLKKYLASEGIQKLVAFQTRNPIHRAHFSLTQEAIKQTGGHLLIHPVVGATKPGDIDYFTRVRCYQKILPYYPSDKVSLSLLPLAMRMAGPREALWHALIRKNYGCTHFIVGRDHAGPGKNTEGQDFYSPFAAQEYVKAYEKEIGIEILTFPEMVYVKERNAYCASSDLKADETPRSISGTALRQALVKGEALPSWFSFPEILEELKHSYLSSDQKGLTLFLTGLSGAGKSTIAKALIAKLKSRGKSNISFLDADSTRRILSTELGFSEKDRNLNVRRIGFVAEEVTKVGGIAICAAIAPYEEARLANRQAISAWGGYIEIFVSTALSVCEGRDTKGLYANSRQGLLKGLTGVDDPYEKPKQAEIEIDTARTSVDEAVSIILRYLEKQGYLLSEVNQTVKNSEVILEVV